MNGIEGANGFDTGGPGEGDGDMDSGGAPPRVFWDPTVGSRASPLPDQPYIAGDFEGVGPSSPRYVSDGSSVELAPVQPGSTCSGSDACCGSCTDSLGINASSGAELDDVVAAEGGGVVFSDPENGLVLNKPRRWTEEELRTREGNREGRGGPGTEERPPAGLPEPGAYIGEDGGSGKPFCGPEATEWFMWQIKQGQKNYKAAEQRALDQAVYMDVAWLDARTCISRIRRLAPWTSKTGE